MLVRFSFLWRVLAAASVLALLVGTATAANAAWNSGKSGGDGQIKGALLGQPTISGTVGSSCGNSGRKITVTLSGTSGPTGMSNTKVQIARSGTSGGEDFTSPIATLANGSTTYDDSAIVKSTTYYYKARLIYPASAQWVGVASAEVSGIC